MPFRLWSMHAGGICAESSIKSSGHIGFNL